MKFLNSILVITFFCLTIYSGWNMQYGHVRAEDEEPVIGTQATGTDSESVKREEEQIKLDGLNVAQLKELREKAGKQEFVAEVNRMMKLIINSLYKNKEIFLRELISNASDALDKIRFLALTDKEAMASNEQLDIRIKVDKENRMLHITDTGIGMTKDDLVKYLGTIAKSQTSEFLNKFQEAQSSDSKQNMNDLIGQFGVGFYSAFLVADKVLVTSKNNADEQYIWESDSNSFIVSSDPRGNTLGRGTTISLHLKEEAQEFLEDNKLREIISRYSQFINFNIYLWASKTVSEEVPIEDSESAADATTTAKPDGEDATVEEAKEEEKPKTKKVDKTVWDWELMNEAKPIWQRKPAEVEESEYIDFYKVFTKDKSSEPLDYTHFIAEGEVTFRSILFVPKKGAPDMYQQNKKNSDIRLYVRRVFISDMNDDLLPKYLNFIKGIVDSDDLPLNVSRETLQQNKLLRVIKKKLVRKVLDMFKKMTEEKQKEFWTEYGTSIKMGIIEDSSNRIRLAKLLRFASSSTEGNKQTTLESYVSRMKEQQKNIYYIAGTSRVELEQSPFVERVLKKGYEVLYLIDPIDEYVMQNLPDFQEKQFLNVAKEGLKLDDSKQAEERLKELEKTYEPLANWIKETALKDKVQTVKVSDRLVKTPMALVATQFGYSGNMERIARAQAYQRAGGDSMSNYYLNQKKILEINPGHPLIKEMLKRVETDAKDQEAIDLTHLMFEAATLRSGFELKDSAGFADRIETMMRSALNISPEEQVDEVPEFEDETSNKSEQTEEVPAEEDSTLDQKDEL